MKINDMSIYYRPDDYYPATSRIYGRMSANAGLLQGIIQYGRRSSLGFYLEEESHFTHLNQQLSSHLKTSAKSIQPIYFGDVLSLNKYDLYFSTDPLLAKSAWPRAMFNSSAYSLCGLTHSFSSLSVVEEIGKLILAPIEPWDALICTSEAVKSAVQQIFQQWNDYFKQYRKITYQSELQLPVIPLGIHVNEISCIKDKTLQRKEFREKWKIKENDFVVLFHGRLSYYEKAHPIPMYLALENLAKRVKPTDTIYCLQAGWFQTKEDLQYYNSALEKFSPLVKSIFLLDITHAEKFAMWSGADIFISLSDNIQESFGLTPLEAMANALPVIVSDWDGYRDTVRHGIDGFLIPSILPPQGCGNDLALGYLSQAINYYTYCGLSAQMTAIDIRSCTEALWALYSSKELRCQMGAAGRQHVLNNFDWQHIIKKYDSLWDDLTKRRLHAKDKYTLSISPMLADPFLTYARHATHTLKSTDLVSLSNAANERMNDLEKNPLSHFGWQQLLPSHLFHTILHTIHQNKIQSVEQIVNHLLKLDASLNSGVIVRTLTYLIKYHILQYE